MNRFEFTENFALSLDAADSLRGFRDHFLVPEKQGKQRMYFLGNSLGLQPKTTQGAINTILQHWAEEGVESFFTGASPWLDLHRSLLEPLSVIAGAKPSELSVMN